jgi:hypothetical protein
MARQAMPARRTAAAVVAPNQNIENNPMQRNGGRRHGCLTRKKHFDTSGKSAAHFHHRANRRPAHGPAHRALRVIAGQKFRSELRTVTVHLIAVSSMH